MNGNALNFYLALLSLQMAILGFVIAGIVALVQMLQSARPRRQISLLVQPVVLGAYLAILAGLLIVLCLATWSIAFEPSGALAQLFQGAPASGILLAACLVGLSGFVWLIIRARQLLDNDDYVTAYFTSITPSAIRSSLFKLYAERPSGGTDTQSQHKIALWERHYQKIKHRPDPFVPLREYMKDSADKSDDYSTANALNLFGQYFDRGFEAIAHEPESQEFFYLASFLHDNAEEFFKLFSKLSLEKRKSDTIKLTHAKVQKFLTTPHQEGLLTGLRGLEHLARSGADEGEILMCIERIQSLTAEYIAIADDKDAPWSEVGPIFEGACLCVGRIAEAYYLQGVNPLHAIPMLSHNSGEYRTVTGAFVEFFGAFRQLADRFQDTYPEQYFETIEGVTEVLLTRYTEIADTTQEKIGLGNTYQQLARELYGIYREIGLDAIEHHKPKLLTLCVINLGRILSISHYLELPQEQQNLATILLELNLRALTELGEITLPDGTLSNHIQKSLQAETTPQIAKTALRDARERTKLKPALPA